jgi:hypothetical protein
VIVIVCGVDPVLYDIGRGGGGTVLAFWLSCRKRHFISPNCWYEPTRLVVITQKATILMKVTRMENMHGRLMVVCCWLCWAAPFSVLTSACMSDKYKIYRLQ